MSAWCAGVSGGCGGCSGYSGSSSVSVDFVRGPFGLSSCRLRTPWNTKQVSTSVVSFARLCGGSRNTGKHASPGASSRYLSPRRSACVGMEGGEYSWRSWTCAPVLRSCGCAYIRTQLSLSARNPMNFAIYTPISDSGSRTRHILRVCCLKPFPYQPPALSRLPPFHVIGLRMGDSKCDSGWLL